MAVPPSEHIGVTLGDDRLVLLDVPDREDPLGLTARQAELLGAQLAAAAQAIETVARLAR